MWCRRSEDPRDRSIIDRSFVWIPRAFIFYFHCRHLRLRYFDLLENKTQHTPIPRMIVTKTLRIVGLSYGSFLRISIGSKSRNMQVLIFDKNLPQPCYDLCFLLSYCLITFTVRCDVSSHFSPFPPPATLLFHVMSI